MIFKTQKEAKARIQAAIDTNVRAVYKALLIIYQRQTPSERCTGQAIEDNGRGFGAFDAEILTSFAEQLQQRGWLTEKQIEMARKKVRRYWRQLMEHGQHAA